MIYDDLTVREYMDQLNSDAPLEPGKTSWRDVETIVVAPVTRSPRGTGETVIMVTIMIALVVFAVAVIGSVVVVLSAVRLR